MIVPPKTSPIQIKFRWPADVVADLKAIAEKTDRTINETAELLVRWAIEKSKAELDLVAQEESPLKRKRQ